MARPTMMTVGSSVSIASCSTIDPDERRDHIGYYYYGQRPERIQLSHAEERQIEELARTLTTHTVNEPPIDGSNPFHGSDDPQLVPGSGEFSHKAWIRSVLALQGRNPDRFPGSAMGVSFKNLGAYGYGTSTDFQRTVTSVMLEAGSLIRRMLGLERTRKIQILRNFDGLVKSGEMLIVLGRPGSGCTTFLKTISGETHGFYLEDQSQIHYQGIPRETMAKNFRGEVLYQAETDHHFPQLTVGDTLSFAARARAPRNRLDGVTREQWADHMRDVTMAVLGLSHTVNTRVGDNFIRGVSGGERKRVSIAEAILSGAPIQCWDNSTRGLDSATALEFVKTLRNGAEATGSAAIVAIYQASQSAYDVFDKVTVLYEGRQIFFGPTDQAKDFFLDLGYDCPPRQTTADFLTSLTNPSERIVRPGWENRVPRTPDEFAHAWKASVAYKRLRHEINEYDKEYPVGGPHFEEFKRSRKAQQAKRVSVNSPYTLSVPMQVRLCMTRGWQRIMADKSIAIATVVGNSVLTLILATVFLNRPDTTDSFFSRGSLLFYSILMNAFASTLEILTLFQQRPIVEKHSGQYAFYHPYAEALSSIIVELPTKIATSIATSLILYFPTNLRREAGAYFTFLLFSFLTVMVMSMIFRTIGAASRTIHQAMPPASLITLALLVYTGFMIPIADMVPWFRWINYLNPIGYAFEAVMVNEFVGRTFPCTEFIPPYPDASGTNRVCTMVGAALGADVVSGTNYIGIRYDYHSDHLWRNCGILVGFTFFFLTTYLVAVEYISAAKSKGEVLVFKSGHIPPSMKKSDSDIEGHTKGDQEAIKTMADVKAEKDKLKDALQNVNYADKDIFMWRDVCYDIKIKKEPRRLLDHVDGWVMPGTLTALMGVSGAGKTTLLDVLASRVTMGVVSGDMLVNGLQRDPTFQRQTGYVQQQDLHLETSTVREALVFSAELRQPANVPKSEKLSWVEEVIRLLDMQEYADAVVGNLGEGLNVEQRKRLTIAVELAAKPKLLLFLDEPTSGLDSQTAWSICSLMRKLANNGQAILCTIHQPSAILFQEFDRLLFLARGGRTVYFGEIGENSSTLTNYFERNGAHPCPKEDNPAEWMLEVIGAVPGIPAAHDWAEVWKGSPERQAVRREIGRMQRQLSRRVKGISIDGSSFAAPFSKQLWLVYKRVNEQYWRTPTYIWSKMILSTFTALFIGFSFYQANNTLQGMQNQLFSVFTLLTVFLNMVQMIMPHFVTQRSLYEARERPSRTYSWQSFMLANIFVEIPWQALMAAFAFVSFYYPIGLDKNATWMQENAERAGLFFLLILAFYIFSSTFSHMVIAGVATADVGGMFANLMFSLSLIFCGVLVMPTGFWIFMYRVSPFTYLVSALITVGIARAPVTCSSIELNIFDPPSGATCETYLEPFLSVAPGKLINGSATSQCEYCQMQSTDTFLAVFNAFYSERWRNFGLLFAYLTFNVFAALFLYWLARVPRGEKKTETAAQQSGDVTPDSMELSVFEPRKESADSNGFDPSKPILIGRPDHHTLNPKASQATLIERPDKSNQVDKPSHYRTVSRSTLIGQPSHVTLSDRYHRQEQEFDPWVVPPLPTAYSGGDSASYGGPHASAYRRAH